MLARFAVYTLVGIDATVVKVEVDASRTTRPEPIGIRVGEKET
jgi:hypothetical protein